MERALILCTCREINVPIQFMRNKARLVLENAVVSELLNRLQAAGKADVWKQAEDAWMSSVIEHGYLKGEDMIFPENIALLVTCTK